MNEQMQAMLMGALLKKLIEQGKVKIETENQAEKKILISFDLSGEEGKLFGKVYFSGAYYDKYKSSFIIKEDVKNATDEQKKED